MAWRSQSFAAACIVLLSAIPLFGQGTTFPVVNRNGQPVGGASVAICTGTNPGTSQLPCTSLATTFIDETLTTQCTKNAPALNQLHGAGCTNPGFTNPQGNAITFTNTGAYWAQVYGYQITPSAFPFTVGGTGGGGTDIPNYAKIFASQTTVDIPQSLSTITTPNVLLQCFDTSSPPKQFEPDHWTINGTTLDVTVYFSTAASGYCVVNSSGGPAGSGSVNGEINPKLPPYSAACSGGDDSSAFSAAIAAAGSGGTVFVPNGTCKVNLTISGLTNFTMYGEIGATLKPFDTTKDVIAFTGAGNFNKVSGLTLTGTGAGTGSGISLSGTTSNTQLSNLTVTNFPGSGIACNSSGSSGNSLLNSYVMYNAGYNLYWNGCNDFHITGTQFGGTNTAPAYGAYFNNSSAGQFYDNFVWSNVIGVEFDSSSYNWIVDNRITQSSKQGLVLNGGSSGGYEYHIDGNQLYQNSTQGCPNGGPSGCTSIGTYESFKVVKIGHSQIKNNHCYDWTGVAHTSYCLTVDINSFDMDIQNNKLADIGSASYTIAPTNILSSSNIYQQNNTPFGVATVNASLTPPVTGSPTVGQAACIKSAGPPVVLGYCSTTPTSGTCTCN